MEFAVAARKPLGQFAANHMWREDKDKDRDIHINHGLTLVDCFDDEAMENFKENLRTWIVCGSDWRKSYAHMMGCLWRRNEYSADRLLSACRWLEDIPGVEPLVKMTAADLRKIVENAQSTAREIGRADLDDRIKGSLKRIGLENHEDRFRRVLSRIQLDAISPVTPKKFIKDLVHSQRVRGTAAHTLLQLEDENEKTRLYDAIEAVEALCFLLTIGRWPKAKDNIIRLREHHFLHSYRVSAKRD